jgi:hypothetical protein
MVMPKSISIIEQSTGTTPTTAALLHQPQQNYPFPLPRLLANSCDEFG